MATFILPILFIPMQNVQNFEFCYEMSLDGWVLQAMQSFAQHILLNYMEAGECALTIRHLSRKNRMKQ